MNFKQALRKLSPKDEVWGRIPDNHFFRQRVSRSRVLGLDPFDWLIIKQMFFQITLALCLLAFVLAIALSFRIPSGKDAVTVAWVCVATLVITLLAFFLHFYAMMASDSANRFLKLFLRTTGLKGFDSVLTFSPSELESFCLHRLRHLAKEVMTAEADFLPLDDKRTVTREAMREAYWFFRENGLVPETHWKHFFQ